MIGVLRNRSNPSPLPLSFPVKGKERGATLFPLRFFSPLSSGSFCLRLSHGSTVLNPTQRLGIILSRSRPCFYLSHANSSSTTAQRRTTRADFSHHPPSLQ